MDIDFLNSPNADSGVDEKVKVNRLDPKSNFLSDKLTSSDNSIIIGITEDNQKIDLKALSGNAKYIHIQQYEAPQWMIHHNMNNNFVTIFVMNEFKEQIFGNVINLNENVSRIIFSMPVKGYAIVF